MVRTSCCHSWKVRGAETVSSQYISTFASLVAWLSTSLSFLPAKAREWQSKIVFLGVSVRRACMSGFYFIRETRRLLPESEVHVFFFSSATSMTWIKIIILHESDYFFIFLFFSWRRSLEKIKGEFQRTTQRLKKKKKNHTVINYLATNLRIFLFVFWHFWTLIEISWGRRQREHDAAGILLRKEWR